MFLFVVFVLCDRSLFFVRVHVIALVIGSLVVLLLLSCVLFPALNPLFLLLLVFLCLFLFLLLLFFGCIICSRSLLLVLFLFLDIVLVLALCYCQISVIVNCT